MGASRKEVEIKVPFATAEDAIRKIERLGATLVQPREFEDNVVYDRSDGELVTSGKLLRLRRCGPTVTLTFKGTVPGEHRYKVRTEHETTVSDLDEMERILHGLGYEPVYRYQKYRAVHRLEGVDVALDELPIGCFVELEGEPSAIDRVAGDLGFTADDYIRATYRDLHHAHAAARGVPPGNLVFDRDRKDSSP